MLMENNRQLILSTDGKHTVIATADDEAEATAALQWAMATCDQIVARCGTKDKPVIERRSGLVAIHGMPADDAQVCAVHGQPMARRVGPTGAFWSCSKRLSDGSFCRYRPNGVLV